MCPIVRSENAPTDHDSLLVLINPISGRGEGRRVAQRIRHIFHQEGLTAEVMLLSAPGEASSLIAQQAAGHAAVVAVGGDGTMNEVAAAMYHQAIRRPLGLIPLGLSNCLARHWGHPLVLTDAIRVIKQGRTQSIPLAIVRDRVVLAFLGAGLDAAIARRVALKRQGTVRDWDYVKAAAVTMVNHEWTGISVEVDGRLIPGRFFQILLSPITNYAHFFSFPEGPGFRIYLFRDRGHISLIHVLPRLGRSRDLSRVCDRMIPVHERLRIWSDQAPVYLQMDGEAGGSLPVECEIKPNALELFVP